MKHGFYSVVPGVRVDDLVQQYRESGLDPDGTDDDMLYLRAYLDELKDMRPDSQKAAELLREGIVLMQAFLRASTDEDHPFNPSRRLTVQEVLSQTGLLESLKNDLNGLREIMKTMLAITSGLEERHERLVMLAKVRADTRLKNAAAQQLDAFMVMVERLVTINSETLPSHYAEALATRYKKAFEELPGRAAKVVDA